MSQSSWLAHEQPEESSLERLTKPKGIEREVYPGTVQDGEVYHAKSGTCAVEGQGEGRGKRKGLDRRTMPGRGPNAVVLRRSYGAERTRDGWMDGWC